MPWLLWGHDVARRREEDDASSITGAELVVPEKPIPHKETPDSIGQQFFDTVVIPSDGRVPGSKMYTAYVRWCADHGHEAMGHHAFGLDPPWDKLKIGGIVWYLNCSIAEAYAAPQLRIAYERQPA